MRKNAAIALLLLSVLLVATAGERASSPAASSEPPFAFSPPAAEAPPPCSGDDFQDWSHLRDALDAGRMDAVDAILACGAPIAAGAPGYRASLTHLIHAQHERLAHLQGYQDWASSTVLRFEEPLVRSLPKEWREQGYTIDSAILSPNGEHAAARLRSGDGSPHIGWWRVLGGDQGLYHEAGYDLAWGTNKFAYLVPGQIQIVTVAPQPRRTVVQVPGHTQLRHTYWRAGELYYRRGSDEVVMAIADPNGSPTGIAYVVRLGLVDDFSVNMTPLSWVKMTIPDWLTQPWHPDNGLLLTLADRSLVYPNLGGSPFSPFQLPDGARPISQVWSPLGQRFAVVVEGAEGIFAHIFHPTQEPRDPHPVYPIEAKQLAVSDDGATLFVAQGALLTARNYMADTQQAWRLDGPVMELRHVSGAIHAVLPDRVVVIPYE